MHAACEALGDGERVPLSVRDHRRATGLRLLWAVLYGLAGGGFAAVLACCCSFCARTALHADNMGLHHALCVCSLHNARWSHAAIIKLPVMAVLAVYICKTAVTQFE